MNRKYIFLIAYLFSSTTHAGDALKNREDMETTSFPYQTTQTSDHNTWDNWSYEEITSTENSSDSEKNDWGSYAEYQDEHPNIN
jgi:hypothetical protein